MTGLEERLASITWWTKVQDDWRYCRQVYHNVLRFLADDTTYTEIEILKEQENKFYHIALKDETGSGSLKISLKSNEPYTPIISARASSKGLTKYMKGCMKAALSGKEFYEAYLNGKEIDFRE